METIRVPNTGGFSALPTGTVLDRYRIESVIAAGGFGITYLARHVTLEKPYALKEHFPRQLAYREGTTSEIKATDPDTYAWALDRFVQEGRTLAQCHHPNVVSVADVFDANGTAYMALGYEQGQSFRSWLEALGRRPSQAELDAILTPLLSALEYVHGKGLLHRDIAPDNIMIRMDGTPCLIDFGAARQAVAERSQMMSAIVKSGFSPPEQYARSGRAQGPWSDIYALGATLYRAVSGTMPQEATERQIDDELRPVSKLVTPKAYRPGFLDAIDTALRLRYDGRPQTISAWREQLFADRTTDAPSLQRAQATRQVTFTELPSPPRPPATPPPSKRTRRAWQIAAGGFATILIAGGAGWWLAPRTPDLRIAKWEEERKAAQELAAKEIAKAKEQLEASKALLNSQEEQRKKWAEERAKAEAEREQIATEQRAREAAEQRRKQEADARARAQADARRKAEEAERSRDPIATLVPGSGQSARDRLVDGSACAFCPEMVVVPAGRFRMGSPESEPQRESWQKGTESPQLDVTIAQPFAVGRHAITRGEFAAFVRDSGHKIDPGCYTRRGKRELKSDGSWQSPGFEQDDRHPVVCVDWDDAKAYAAWLSKKTGKTYQLPSEAEREYFTRAGTTTPFWWGSSITPEQANYNGNYTYAGGGRNGAYRGGTVSVDTFKPNSWGFYQVHGNVWEWTEDCWTDSHAGNPGDGSVRTNGDCSRHVVRGGSWVSFPRFLRSADRSRNTSTSRYLYLGFRLVRTLNP